MSRNATREFTTTLANARCVPLYWGSQFSIQVRPPFNLTSTMVELTELLPLFALTGDGPIALEFYSSETGRSEVGSSCKGPRIRAEKRLAY